jgi:16S rRNA U1498 N3-methylase RsmE
VPAAEVLPEGVAAEPGGRRVQSMDRLIAIGPEGGWTPGELALAQDQVGLGEAVLRVETAALVACVELCDDND